MVRFFQFKRFGWPDSPAAHEKTMKQNGGTVVEYDSAKILYLQEFGPTKLRIVKIDYLLTSVIMIHQ